MDRTVASLKIAAIVLVLSAFLILSISAELSDETDAAIIIEGDLTPTAKYRLTDDYTLYFEGTGVVSTECTIWIDYVKLIRVINVSNGITELEPTDLMLYTGLSEVHLGRDLEYLDIYTPIDKVVFFNGCGEMQSLTAEFRNECILFLYEEVLMQIKDSYSEIYCRLVPNQEVPEEAKAFVGFDRTYEVHVPGVGYFDGESMARVIYGDSTIPMTVYHLLPTYMVSAEVDYFCTFILTDNGYYVLHIEVEPLIPESPLIALAMVALFTILAIIYYFKIIKVKQ